MLHTSGPWGHVGGPGAGLAAGEAAGAPESPAVGEPGHVPGECP